MARIVVRGDMLLEKIFNSKTQIILNKAMDSASARTDVIANNIANVDTPGFKRSELIFEEKLNQILDSQANTGNDKLRTTNKRHIQIGQAPMDLEGFEPEIRKLEDLSYRNDENNVDIDVENANMTKNKVFYDSMAQSMSNEIKLLRMAITGRG
ncbi:MAG: flagellar basal body rod protein FlgB [Firmicutes bacterium HGW-Firmicutes-15]|nr:MAG: flagellar basal body rod protein FlgB [Firmicutes bacterium HGW-Firmicutes-15]